MAHAQIGEVAASSAIEQIFEFTGRTKILCVTSMGR